MKITMTSWFITKFYSVVDFSKEIARLFDLQLEGPDGRGIIQLISRQLKKDVVRKLTSEGKAVSSNSHAMRYIHELTLK